ncbi:MAG TPA: RNA 2',3'-cyclic phosphodiesterase [Pyrinomonadaceae bacterium]|nr:RNA 2',3'-cyclic phosphodiesterase [Pyrinomonadaceae bacterium]
MAPAKEESWRVFCAIELPAVVREAIADFSSKLRGSIPDVRASWIRAHNIHLTLKFLGNISPARVSTLSTAAERTVNRSSSFEIHVEGTGSFPPHGAPRVLWIGLSDSDDQLRRMQKILDEECCKVGFEKDSRVFNPHLTIARVRSREGASKLAKLHRELTFGPLLLSVTELVVIRSELSSAGSRYTVLSRHQLDGAP